MVSSSASPGSHRDLRSARWAQIPASVCDANSGGYCVAQRRWMGVRGDGGGVEAYMSASIVNHFFPSYMPPDMKLAHRVGDPVRPGRPASAPYALDVDGDDDDCKSTEG